MTLSNLLPALIILSALLPGLFIFITSQKNTSTRRILNFTGNISCLIFIAMLTIGVYNGDVFETRLPLLPGIDLVLHADALSLLFVSLSGILWLLTTIYALGYLEGAKHHSRFFGFFSLCVAATLGIALAGNLITFLIFYELLTLVTYPLVVHKGNAASLRAGRIYLTYTMIGGALLLAGVVWLKAIAGPLDFTATGVLSGLPHLDASHLTIIFGLLIIGLGVKAALVPLHGWLPIAMAAPAPVSALLHAVAVVKAGAFGIIRVVYDVYGIEFARGLGLTFPLALLAGFTIVYGSVRALFQDDLKKRLAYSTVSQVSYIALGTAIAGPIATIGGMVHLVHQGLMKITMFFCAGNLAETVGIHKVSELNGVAKRMPLTMTAFSIAALGMVGLPPVAGFVSKWYLGMGALEVNAYWVLGVLAISSLLNAMYFLPILYAAWFKPADARWAQKQGKFEAPWMLLLPPVITAGLALAAGIFASTLISPVSWAELIAAREYGKAPVGTLTQLGFTLPLMGWIIIVPLVLAIALLIPALRQVLIRLTPWAALPALLVALFAPEQSLTLPYLFFGSSLILDGNTKIMLLLAASLWLIAGIYGLSYLAKDKHMARYSVLFLLCMTGSFGLTLSHDLFGFITFFTLMSFSAYGLVVHSGTDEANKAGKTYIQWVVIGEVILFAALVGLAISGGGETLSQIDKHMQPPWVSWLLILGFGIKAGLLGTHFWLPLAHPVAPVPASALLSGLMVKAGLIGWWRFLPLGEATLPDMGLFLIILGLAGALIAALIGITRNNPKSVLAYSTVSQMGIVTTGIGAGLNYPELWPLLSSALLLYAVHHGLAKAALFLSVGLSPVLAHATRGRWLIWAGVIIPAIAMVGLPLSSGALAKSALKNSVGDIAWLVQLLPLTAIGTTMLMLRFIILIKHASTSALAPAEKIHLRLLPFVVLILMVVALPYILPLARGSIAYAFSGAAIWSAVWPAAIGAFLYFSFREISKKGDLLHITRFRSLTPPTGDSTMATPSHWQSHTGELFKQFSSIFTILMMRVEHAARSSYFSNVKIHPGIVLLVILVGFTITLALDSST